MRAPREELARLMGMNDSEYKSAGQLDSLLQVLHQQRQHDINSNRGGYPYAAAIMYMETFGRAGRSTYDSKRKSLWYLGEKPPKESEEFEFQVCNIFHVIQKRRYLQVYADWPGPPSRKIMTFDMLKPEHRVAFFSSVRRLAVEKHSASAKHKDLLRVQQSSRRKSQRRKSLESVLERAAKRHDAEPSSTEHDVTQDKKNATERLRDISAELG